MFADTHAFRLFFRPERKSTVLISTWPVEKYQQSTSVLHSALFMCLLAEPSVQLPFLFNQFKSCHSKRLRESAISDKAQSYPFTGNKRP